MEKWYYRRLVWNGNFIFGSLLLFKKEFCALGQHVILWLLCICLITTFLIDLVPSIRKKDKYSGCYYFLPENSKLLYLTRNVDLIIVRCYFVSLGLIVLNFFLSDTIPILLSYVYWILFGAYFTIKIVRYSDHYSKKYER